MKPRPRPIGCSPCARRSLRTCSWPVPRCWPGKTHWGCTSTRPPMPTRSFAGSAAASNDYVACTSTTVLPTWTLRRTAALRLPIDGARSGTTSRATTGGTPARRSPASRECCVPTRPIKKPPAPAPVQPSRRPATTMWPVRSTDSVRRSMTLVPAWTRGAASASTLASRRISAEASHGCGPMRTTRTPRKCPARR